MTVISWVRLATVAAATVVISVAAVYAETVKSGEPVSKNDSGDANGDGHRGTQARVRAPNTAVDVDDDKVRVDAPYTGVRVDRDRVRVRAPFVDLDIRR